MSRLYIVGNGFDIAHGIPCKYSDFRRYCEEKMPKMYLLAELKKRLKISIFLWRKSCASR